MDNTDEEDPQALPWGGVTALPRPTADDPSVPTPDAMTGAGDVVPNDPMLSGRPLPSDPNNPQAPTILPPVATPPTQVKGSVSGSHSGMTAAGLARSKSLFGDVDQQVDAQMAPEAAGLQASAKRFDSVFQEKRAAIGLEAKAQEDHYARVSALINRQQDFNQHAAQIEQQAGQQADVEAKQYRASIQEQLAGVRSLIQQTGDPRARLSGTQVFGLGLAAAAQGFLAVRGIKIDVTGQIDHWVEQGMQEHQQMVQNSQAALQDTFHLYEVARQSSKDAFEARQRYRGFIIEGFKGQVEAEAARFGSDVANANAQATIAQLDGEQATTLDGLQERYRKERFDMRKQIIDETYKQGTLAIEKEKNSIAWAELAAKKNALKPAKEPDLPSYISDPSLAKKDQATGKVITGGKIVAMANPKSPNAATYTKELSDAFTAKQRLDTGLQRLRELKPDGATWSTFTRDKTSPDYRRFTAAKSELLADLLAAKSGKVVTDAEYERYAKMIQEDKGWQEGDNDALLDEMQASGRDNLNARYSAGIASGDILAVTPGQQFDARYGADKEGYLPYSQPLDQPGSQLDEAQRKGGKPIPTAVSAEEQNVNTAGDDGTSRRASKAFGEFASRDPNSGARYSGSDEHNKGHLFEPDWAHHLDMIAVGMVRPDILKQFHENASGISGEKGAEETPAKVAADAYEALRGISHGEHGEPEYMQNYAKHLRELVKDPEKAMREISGDAP